MIRAVIFDLDGTIIDNEGLYEKAFKATLKRLGISPQDIRHTVGIGVHENWIKIKRDHDLSLNPSDLTAQTQHFYLDNLDKVRVRPGFLTVANYLRKGGIKLLLVTSNTSDIGQKVVAALKLNRLFSSTTFGDEVIRKKPAPDIFLRALEKEKLDPQEAVVIEDSPSGIGAAKNAGIRVFALKTDLFSRAELAEANRIIKSFTDLKKAL